MEKYAQKTPFAAVADKILWRLLVSGVSAGWFIYLWGVSLASLAAGVSLGVLLWLCVRRFEKMSVQKKEQQMRRAIGGELALDKLLLIPSRHAAFQTAMWLMPKAPLELQKTTEWGVLCKLKEETLLVRLIAQHKSLPVTVQQVIDAHKESLEHKVNRCVICLTAPASREAKAYAERCDPKLRLVPREEMVRLAGLTSPATDEQLSALGNRRKGPVGWRRWVEHVLAPKRARHYFFYGLGLAVLYFLTGLWYYPIPAILCLLLCVLCRVYRPREEAFL